MISQYSSKCVAKESNGSHHFFLVNNDHGFEHEVKQRKSSFFKAKSTKIVDLMIVGPLACEWLLEIFFFLDGVLFTLTNIDISWVLLRAHSTLRGELLS